MEDARKKITLDGVKKDKLEQLLGAKALDLITSGVVNIKEYEYAFQDVIENYTKQIWWKITNYFDIFMSLLQTGNPKKTIEEVMEHVKADENNNILVNADVNSNVIVEKLQGVCK